MISTKYAVAQKNDHTFPCPDSHERVRQMEAISPIPCEVLVSPTLIQEGRHLAALLGAGPGERVIRDNAPSPVTYSGNRLEGET